MVAWKVQDRGYLRQMKPGYPIYPKILLLLWRILSIESGICIGRYVPSVEATSVTEQLTQADSTTVVHQTIIQTAGKGSRVTFR